MGDERPGDTATGDGVAGVCEEDVESVEPDGPCDSLQEQVGVGDVAGGCGQLVRGYFEQEDGVLAGLGQPQEGSARPLGVVGVREILVDFSRAPLPLHEADPLVPL